ncbi:MAG TPA: ATP-binding protein, partial [Candidatus Krumholzibacteria bacterium]
MTTLATLQSLIVQGESETLELKRSTAELKRAGETLCAFLNGEGGKVLIGVGPDGALWDEVPARLPAGAAQARALPGHEDHRRHPRQQAGVPARVRDGPRGDRVARP